MRTYYHCSGCKQEYAVPRSSSYCVTCGRKARRRSYENRSQEMVLKDRARALDYFRLKTYGLTREEYDEVVAQPCAICGTIEVQRVPDHNHETGRVRGALCGNHNLGIAYFSEDVELLKAAIRYLEEHNGGMV